MDSQYKNKSYVMISYNHNDFTIAESFRKLFEENGIKVWMAPHSIPYGRNYIDDIASAIQGAAALVVLLSEESQKSEWVKKEVQGAIETYKTTVIPIFVTDCTFVHPFDFMIGRNQGTKVIDYEELLINPENTIQDLVKQIQELVGSSSKKVKINNVDLFYDSTKLKKDVSSLIDALISIEVKYGLYCRKMGKYNIEFEVLAIEEFLMSSSSNHFSHMFGRERAMTKIMLLYYITSNDCKNDIAAAAREASTVLKQLIDVDNASNKSIVEDVKKMYLEKKANNYLFDLFDEQVQNASRNRENEVLRKMEFLYERVKGDPRIGMFYHLMKHDNEGFKRYGEECRRVFGEDFDFDSFTDADLLEEYKDVLADFK